MPSKTISVTNGDGSTRTITIPDRSRFAGVKTFSRNGKLDDNTTSIQVTVAGHSDLNGIYTGSIGGGLPWTQQGGNGKIRTSGYNSENNSQIWFVMDDNDYDPDGDSEAAFGWSGSGESPAPWTHLPSSHNVTITPVPETVTVNRTAPVITSDRKGASRPLLSKVVGGAAAAYSLRDLNDKAGNNKVVRVRRASDNHERDFLAKEVSNGTLENWVNTQVTAPLDIREIADSNSDGNNDGRVGDFLIAKAAYSLRSLGTRQATLEATGDTVARANGKFVAQVRRNVDGNLKSFTADEVTDGTLTSFVNESFTSSLPLDVQGSAAAAYSLRNLSSSYSGNVVEVRNGAGNTQNFTAAEVTDGTLVDFVLGNTKSLLNSRAYFDGSGDRAKLTSEINMTGDFSVEYTFVVTETNQQIIGKEIGGSYIRAGGSNEINSIRVSTDGAAATLGLTSNLKYGEANTIKLKRVSGTFGIYNESDVLISSEFTNSDTFTVQSFGRARGSFAKGVIYNIRIDTNNDGTINHSYNGYGNTLSDWTDLVGSNNAISVSGNPALFTGQDQDGFVKTWYDQSGNSNDLTQPTAGNQPEIVSGGNLNKRNNKPIVKFIQANSTFLKIDDSSMFPTGSNIAVTIFHAMHIDSSSGNRIGLFGHNGGGNNTSVSAYRFGSGTGRRVIIKYRDAGNTQVEFNSGFHTNDTDSILTYQFAVNGGTVSLQTFNNGSSASSNSSSLTDQSYSPVSDAIILGARSTADNFADSEFFEIIAYSSDQLANRPAIEESIATNYGITLASFNRDGFVKTWYDQSVDAGGGAHGNHATQATAASQPKIVSAGSLISNGLDFDGTDDFFSCSAFGVSGTTSRSMFHVLFRDTNSANDPLLGIGNGVSASDGKKWHVTSEPSILVFGGNEKYASSAPSAVELFTNIFAGTNVTDNSFFKNGSEVTATSSSSKVINTDETVTNIGKGGTGAALHYDGRMAEFIIYATDQTDNRTAIEANIGEAYSISGIPAYDNTVDGFVEAWYDQSGNERHAEQGASANQPKIVDSGVLKKDTDGNPYLQFDGSQYFRIYKNNSLSEGLILPVIQDTFSVCVFSHTTSSSKFLAQLNRSGDRYYLYNRKIIIGNNQTILDSASENTKHVRSLTASASGVFNSYVDSVLIGTKTDTNTASGGDSSIGATNTGSSGLVGAIYELVAYRTDHSANRLAIEANINNQYEIS